MLISSSSQDDCLIVNCSFWNSNTLLHIFLNDPFPFARFTSMYFYMAASITVRTTDYSISSFTNPSRTTTLSTRLFSCLSVTVTCYANNRFFEKDILILSTFYTFVRPASASYFVMLSFASIIVDFISLFDTS